MEMAQPVARQAPLGQRRTNRAGMPASRSGDRLHFGGESSTLATGPTRTKATRVPATRVQDGKPQPVSNTARRALGDVSNIDKTNVSHGRAEAQHLKPGSHMRGISNASNEEQYKHKIAPNGVKRETKSRGGSSTSVSTSASSNSTSSASQQTVKQAGVKRVRAVKPVQSEAPSAAPSRSTSSNARLIVTKPGLRHASSQPFSMNANASSASAKDARQAQPVKSQSNSGIETAFQDFSKPVTHGADTNGHFGTAAHQLEDEEMSDQDDFTSSEETSDTESSSVHQEEVVQLDDADSIVSAEEGSEGLEFNPDPECLVTLPPQLESEAFRRAAIISAQFHQAVIVPQLAKAAEERIEAVRNGQLPADVAAHDDELAQMGLDPEEVRDTSMVAEYSKEIFAYMAKCEMETLANPQYITYQNELHWHMRTTLVDWLLQVHTRYHMLPETLFIAINIVDRFLSVRVVSLAKLQLVGVTAMFIAAKYEEIVAPSVDEFVYMTEGGYSKDEIFKGERIVLQTLDFKVSSYCSPYSWVRKISKADDYDIQVRTLAKFLMEMTLLDHRFLRAKPSLIAGISMYLSKKMLGGQWNEAFVYYSGFCEEQLVPGANLLIERLADPLFADNFVFKKYANRRFLKASMYARDWASRRCSSPQQQQGAANQAGESYQQAPTFVPLQP
ncbi:unnamed protein product [Sympodiomycopsis kandeliae]